MVILGLSGLETRSDRTDERGPSDARAPHSRGLGKPIPREFFPVGLLGHDPAAALLVDGRLAAFVAEERLSRVKHGLNLAGHTVLPRRAAEWCLRSIGLAWSDVDCIAHYCRFTPERLRRRRERIGPGLSAEERAALAREHEDAWNTRVGHSVLEAQIAEMSGDRCDPARLLQVDHHLAHAAAAFYTSPFREAAILTIDGYGEEDSSLWGTAGDGGIEVEGRIPLPDSLGMLYQHVTEHLGFRAFGDEYKVMGLASYGDPAPFLPAFDEHLRLLADGAYRIEPLSGPGARRWKDDALGPVDNPGDYSRKAADIAAALQATLERVLFHQLEAIRRRHGSAHLCMAGGVALNATANGRIRRSGLFRSVHIPPAAGDDGAALGAALYASRVAFGEGRGPALRHAHWGPGYGSDDMRAAVLAHPGLLWREPPDLVPEVAGLLAEGRIVGWFQGRAEMGPRALGARSILADPRRPESRERLNATVKRREPFRPFAPIVPLEAASDWFQVAPGDPYPFMLHTVETRIEVRERIPAVVHIDGSARIQTVSAIEQPRLHRLLVEFGRITGVPVLLNTSFNRAGEPIVNSPEDAVRAFREGGLDALVLEDLLAVPAADDGCLAHSGTDGPAARRRDDAAD